MILTVPFSGGTEIDVPDARAEEYMKRGFAPKANEAPKAKEEPRRQQRKKD